MSRVKYVLNNFEEILIAVMLPLMVVVIFVGTAGRYSKLFLLPWAEELARYLMIWVVFLGIGAGAKRNAHFVVEVLMLILPKSLKKCLRVFTTLFIVAFMAALIYYSRTLISRIMGMQQVSPSMHIPIWTIYLAIPVGCALMAVRTLQKCYIDLTTPDVPPAAATEEKAEELVEIYE